MSKVGGVKCPTLSQVTGERPTCQRCKKPLSPRTSWFELPGRVDHVPTAAEVRAIYEDDPTGWAWLAGDALKSGYEPARAYRVWLFADFDGRPRTKVSYWRGTYDGVGHGKGRPAPLFCSPPCGVDFARLCWEADMRIVPREPQEDS
jgi:hypothetical protein